MLALALRCQQLVQTGVIANYAALAELGHVSRARVTQILNLLLLAPDIRLPTTAPGQREFLGSQPVCPRPTHPGAFSRAIPSIPAGNGADARTPALAPPGRPSWSGLLRISLVSVPVKAYPAVRSPTASPFHFLHADCGQHIRYEKHCPHHGAVPAEVIVRGYEYAPHHDVILEVEELEQLRPARDKALVVEQFVPVADIDPTFYAGRSRTCFPKAWPPKFLPSVN
jgi:hypothetical protein